MKKRKSIHKILAFLLSVTMLPVVFPLKNAQAANKTMFVEDFEDWAVGTIIAATSTQTSATVVGRISYQLVAGDKLEIAQEENGNKYLKITRVDNTASKSYLKYYFPETYTNDKYVISYDFKPENHSMHFFRFGSFIRDNNGSESINLTTISYGYAFYAHNTTANANPYRVPDLFESANYNNTYLPYGTITQTIDLTKSSENYEFNAYYPDSNGTIANNTVTNTANQLGIKGLAWGIQKNATSAAWNGSDTGAAVYRIDNITVSVDGLNVTGSNVVNESEISANEEVAITFDEPVSNNAIQHISIYKNGVLSDLDEYNVNFSTDRKTLTVSGFDYASSYSIKIAKTLKTQDGTKAMLDDYELKFKTNSIISHNITRSKYVAGYTPEITPLDNINYTYSISKDGGAYEEYNLETLNEFGEYSLKIVATDENGKEQSAIIEFQIVGAVAPEIKDIGIAYIGTLDAGTELIGEYTYFDENDNADENKDYCTFQWYRSDKEASGYRPIEGATGEKYVLTEDDQNKYIVFGVKPFSKVSPTEGEEFLTEPFASFMTPEATNISISGKMAVGEELTVNYDYFDLNGDAEITSGTNATTVVWKTSDTSDGEYTEVGSGTTYTLNATDINKWLKVEVTPKNNGGGEQGGAFTSYAVKIIEAASGELFTEDFESYEVGVIHEATEYIRANVGKIHYELYPGDKVEIAQENGNKYLKFTRAAEESNSSYVMYEFPQAYNEGILSVSYDYKPEAHSQCFSRFGTLVSSANGVGKNWAADKPVVQQIISYSKNLYVHSGTNASYYVGGVNNLDNYASNKCATVTQKVDFDSSGNNYTFNAEYKTSSGSYTNIGTIQRTVTARDVNAIAWTLYKNGSASWNGPDSGASVYRIDNIAVKAEGMSVEGLLIADEDSVEITFDEALADSAGDYISVFKGDSELNSNEYAVSVSTDKKKLYISGFDYNTDYRISISSNLAAESGKKLIGGFETEFRTKSIINHRINREKYNMGYVPVIYQLKGVDYTYSISKDGAEYQEYNLEALEELGKYKLKIIAVDENEETQTMTIPFEIVGEIEPEISDIYIRETDTLDIGTVLEGVAVYFDINDANGDDNKDYLSYQWYRSDKKDTGYTPIGGATNINYTLTAQDQDKYIKFGAKPVSKVVPKEGEEALSEAFVSFMNPELTNISIKGKMETYEVLTIDYDYSDLNGDLEITEGTGATVVIWKTSNTLDGAYTEVGRGRAYTLKETDENKWIKATVIPKNNGGGTQDKSFESKAIEGAFSPAVSDVKITGNFNVGSTLGVDYRFYDSNSDSESASIIMWYVGEEFVSSNSYYTITSKDAGKAIYVTVTPKTNALPTTGATVKSAVHSVTSVSTVLSGSGGGGGGGNTITKPQTDENKEQNKDENTNEGSVVTEGSKGFTDTNGHWAEEAIEKMVEDGIIYGKSANSFAPEDKITRAEFATLISRMLNLGETDYEFDDVKAENWYSKTVASVAAAGYMSGYNGNFRPEDNMTREEMAVVIFAIISEKEIKSEAEEISFADYSEISDWAKDAVSAIAKIGIINGMGDNKFAPMGDATRAQTVVMLTRLQDVLTLKVQ